MQKLILPINNARLTASWKTDAYRRSFGFVHYGIDLVSTTGSTLLYASGKGLVLATGSDSILGNFVVVHYTDALNRVTGEVCDIICRMWHMAGVSATRGQRTTRDTRLGYYGNTGRYTTGAHLHLEVDTDTDWPFYTPSLSGRSSHFIGTSHGAHDRSMSNPLEWLHCKTSAPDRQSYTAAAGQYIRSEDTRIATIQ